MLTDLGISQGCGFKADTASPTVAFASAKLVPDVWWLMLVYKGPCTTDGMQGL